MDKKFILILLVITGAFVGIFMYSGGKSPSTSKTSTSNAQGSKHLYGNTKSKVTLMEFGDYQCPYCYQYEPTVEQIREKYKDRITFQFRNFPISSIHQNAFAGARAAEAASLQGKFWEYHDLLYQDQKTWSEATSPNSYFENYAKQLGLNEAKFKTDFASSVVNDVINADSKSGEKLGVTGTPSFFINGKKTEINNDAASFERVIDAALQKN